jgi:PAS domain S-box-containing protein
MQKNVSQKVTKNPNNNKLVSISSIASSYSSDNPEMGSILSMMEKLLHWAAIIESSDDAIISKSADGYITSWNKGAEHLYGYTPEEIIGQPVSVLMPPNKRDDFPFIMNQLHQGKRVEHYETQRMTKDGEILHVSITVSPIRDTQGNIIGASKIARDITDKVENEKLREEFVSTTSHELKTPLTSQQIFGELLENMIKKNGADEYLPYIQKINLQTKKLTKLVEELLELSRLEMDGLRLENKVFPIDELIQEIIETTKLTTKHKIITKGKTHAYIRGDRDRIGQVLTNLLSNAIKYSPKANKINISSEIKDESVIISVQDFGIGIPEQYKERIFERFFRVTDNDEKTYPGMGIGLHFCKQIIEKHHGRIWATGSKGTGSIFSFSLPYVKTK